MKLEDLQSFAIAGHVSFTQFNADTIVMEISNTACSASIVMQGAHLIHWQPKDCEQPVVWLSSDATFARGKSIRGGIPICWPWFGPHETRDDVPAHGYARTVEWSIVNCQQVSDELTEISFRLIENEHSRAMWPYQTDCIYSLKIGATLELQLVTINESDQSVVLGEALHTYFNIGEIENVRVLGLDHGDYYDKVADRMARQQGAIEFNAETDRVYMNTIAGCTIEDPQLNRRIHIDKTGSQSTVVWNPWQGKADAMGDLGPQGWHQMVCVETANALDNRISLEAGQRHEMTVRYRVESME
jgi:D-hexose-6-phosphate mutarotase